jgi:hypothetical protein
MNMTEAADEVALVRGDISGVAESLLFAISLARGSRRNKEDAADELALVLVDGEI